MSYETLIEKLREMEPREDLPNRETVLSSATSSLESLFETTNLGLRHKRILQKVRRQIDKLQKMVPSDREEFINFAKTVSLVELDNSILIERVKVVYDYIEMWIQDLHRFGYTREAMEYAERYRLLLQQLES